MSRCPVRIRSMNCSSNHCFTIKPRFVALRWSGLLLLFLLVYPVNSSVAQDEPAEGLLPWYGYLYIGDNIGSSGSGKLKSTNYKSGGPPEWGIGIGRHYTKQFSAEGTLEYWGERYKREGALIPGTENNVIQAGGLGLSATALYNFRHQDFHAYFGAGAGYFITGILITEPGSGLLTDQGAPSDKWLPGYHFSIGAGYRLKAGHRLGIELKHRVLKADFGVYTDGEVDLGGTFLLLMYRHDPG